MSDATAGAEEDAPAAAEPSDAHPVAANKRYHGAKLMMEDSVFAELSLAEASQKVQGVRVRQHVNPLKASLQTQAPAPEWREVFADVAKPLVVDIGCGGGRFDLMFAQRHPELNVLGVDIRAPLVDRGNAWGEVAGIVDNVHFAECNATVSIGVWLKSYAALGEASRVDAVTIHYDKPRAVAESELPVKLPELEDFSPGEDPAGCLARCLDWRFFERDGEWFARETNTMPQWAGSCWYYLRFADPTNSKAAWSPEAERSWLPVDLYVGGAEHAVLHLLYARFWHKVLHSLNLVSTAEPFQRLVHQGMILGSDGEKMSKSRGNVVNPDDIIDAYGADAMRLYEMFMGPLEAVKPWQTEQIAGVVRFQNRVHSLAIRAVDDAPLDDATARAMNKAIKKVSEDVDALSFNTAISAMMVYSSHLQSLDVVPADAVRALSLLLSPLAPHLGEETWAMLGGEGSVARQAWPGYDEALCEETDVTMGVQVNGKVRGEVTLPKDADEETARASALKVKAVALQIEGKDVKKFIYKPGRIINFVAK